LKALDELISNMHISRYIGCNLEEFGLNFVVICGILDINVHKLSKFLIDY